MWGTDGLKIYLAVRGTLIEKQGAGLAERIAKSNPRKFVK